MVQAVRKEAITRIAMSYNSAILKKISLNAHLEPLSGWLQQLANTAGSSVS